MLQYILKRLALMVVTLLGITVVTFLITRLAPGDPAVLKVEGAMAFGGGRGQQLSEAIIEENRRILGLDKPILFNLKPKGRREHVQRMIADLASREEYVRDRRGRKPLTVLQSAALPEVFEALDETTTAVLRRRLLDLLPNLIAAPVPPGYDSFSSAKRLDWWRHWWNENQAVYTPANAKKVTDAYFAKPTRENFRRVVAVSGRATPYLMERVNSRDPHIADLATSPLTVIVRRSWSTWGETREDERRRNLYRWRKWWQYHRAEFVDFGDFERLTRMFTDTQYGVWFGKILTFDFDESYVHHRPVLELIVERLPVSLQLSLIAIFLSYVISIPLGVFSATHQFKLSDKIATTGLFILYSLPSFWVADMLILFLTGGEFLHWFPTQGLHSSGAEDFGFWKWLADWIWHLVLPITCLTYASFAFLSRQMRVAMLETVRQDFIRTAQAKGLSRRAVIFKHALRNSLIPILTLMASLLPQLIGGSLIIESIFGIQGMGKLTIDSIISRDYAVINAIFFFSALLTLIGILLSDLSYALVDPRIRYE